MRQAMKCEKIYEPAKPENPQKHQELKSFDHQFLPPSDPEHLKQSELNVIFQKNSERKFPQISNPQSPPPSPPLPTSEAVVKFGKKMFFNETEARPAPLRTLDVRSRLQGHQNFPKKQNSNLAAKPRPLPFSQSDGTSELAEASKHLIGSRPEDPTATQELCNLHVQT